MFTGIILDLGTVTKLQKTDADLRITVLPNKLRSETIQCGDSIAVNGVCLTVTQIVDKGLCFDVSSESLSLTTIGQLQLSDSVNLETALTPANALGGHLVSGHVDGVAEIVQRYSDARSERFVIKAPQELSKYIASKGSVCVDGVSLTVNHVDGQSFGVNIVPHTLKETIFGYYQVGRQVNIEVDIIARYLERLLAERTV